VLRRFEEQLAGALKMQLKRRKNPVRASWPGFLFDGATMKNGFTTKILHSDLEAPIEHFSVLKPMHTAVAFGYPDARDLVKVFKGEMAGYAYGRQGNPTTAAERRSARWRTVLPRRVFDGHGSHCPAFIALLRGGDHVVSSAFLFGNTNSLFGTLGQFDCDISYVDATRVENVEKALRPNTRMVFVETIANPRTQIADLVRIGELCARRGIIYFVDNTMTSPGCSGRKCRLVINS
jgi:O-acetylhomoserine (thiol)-lyase